MNTNNRNVRLSYNNMQYYRL